MRHLPSMSPCAVRGSDVIERSARGKRLAISRKMAEVVGGAAEAELFTLRDFPSPSHPFFLLRPLYQVKLGRCAEP